MSETNFTVAAKSSNAKGRAMNLALWIVQILLTLAYLTAGYQKAFMPFDVIVQTIFWVAYVPHALVRFIGISELLGGIGLIVPAMTGIQPRLSALAAAGLALIMASASVMHAVRGEYIALPTTLLLLCLTAFVAYGRWRLVPIPAKKSKMG
jgi:putative oxidoreductase